MRLLAAHWPFAIVTLAAAALRVVVMLGYPPAMFFNDSYDYLTDAVSGVPDPVRSNGYPFFLRVLLPLHSLNVVTGLQALMGLVMGVGIYAVLRHRGLPWWGATIPALPVLFDVWELQLEHMVAADTLFALLVVVALILLCWSDRPSPAVTALAGLVVGYAALVRTVGEPLLIVFLIGMLARRMGWRRIIATAVAGAAPIIGYSVWFHGTYRQYSLDEALGAFLYSRVSSFAECSRMNPPADLRVLCDPRPPSKRPNSQEYLWANDTPLGRLTGPDNAYRFTPRIDSLTTRFAERAILSQPLDYAGVVWRDTLTTFGWKRANVNNAIGNLEGSGSMFRFEPAVSPVPGWVMTEAANKRAAQDYGGADYGHPKVVQPWAGFLWGYEKVVYLRGTLLFLFVLAGAVGVVLGIRRATRVPGTGWGGLPLLPWLIGAALIVIPPVTAGFSYRYALAAVPPACLAAGLAFAGRGSLLTWLRARRWPRARRPERET